MHFSKLIQLSVHSCTHSALDGVSVQGFYGRVKYLFSFGLALRYEVPLLKRSVLSRICEECFFNNFFMLQWLKIEMMCLCTTCTCTYPCPLVQLLQAGYSTFKKKSTVNNIIVDL